MTLYTALIKGSKNMARLFGGIYIPQSMLRLLYMLTFAAAMTDQQAYIARTIMKARHVPPWSVIVDAALSDQIAFTQQDKLITYIDARRLARAPNTFFNTILHEVQHLKGHQHFDGSIGMQYFITVFPNGSISEDNFKLDVDSPDLPPGQSGH